MKVKLMFLSLLFIMTAVGTAFGQGHSDIFPICDANGMQGWIQAGYNRNADEYLVVWEEYRNSDTTSSDIWGQFVRGDGSLRDTNFVVCEAPGDQFWPKLDFDPVLDRFLVVFEDYRKPQGNGDIRGVFLDADGSFIDAPTSAKDHSFAICANDSSIYTCSVAFNYTDMKYLVVWGDYRREARWPGHDVYGQIIDADGTLEPADSTVNFAIANNVDIVESVPDVTYNSVTNEWFVVFGTDIGYVIGQRVNTMGQLIQPDGELLAKQNAINSWGAGIQLSVRYSNGPDCLQAKVQANNEYRNRVAKAGIQEQTWSECEVVWKGILLPRSDNDVYGQRIGFFLEGDKYVAKYIDLNGNVYPDSICNHEISIQERWPSPPEIAFSAYDNEFLVGWGNETGDLWLDPHDLWGQRLGVNLENNAAMTFLADDRVNTVTSTENILYSGTTMHESGILGIAHSTHRNEFLIAFAYEDTSANRSEDVYGIIVKGSEPTAVKNQNIISSNQFELQQNYPNPFNPETMIWYYLKEAVNVEIAVYDLTGRKIKTLVNGLQSNGSHRIVWNGTNNHNVSVPSGIYLYKMNYDGKSLSRKMSLIR